MTDEITIASSQSLERSLRSIKEGTSGLSERRKRLLTRIPEAGNYANVPSGSVSFHDLAYLCAATGDEIALLRGKREDIIFHGSHFQCVFSAELADMLTCGKLRLEAHTHPGEEIPVPSLQDRTTLQKIGQRYSTVISGITGIDVTYSTSSFDDIIKTTAERRKES